MNLSHNISQLFKNSVYYPKFDIQAGQEQRYKIEMNNQFLNQKGNVVKTQRLVSSYSREIIEMPSDFFATTEIGIERVEFFSTDEQKTMRWTFAEGLKLPHYLYYCNYLDDYKTIANEYESENGLIKQQSQRFSEAFVKFPRLPSVNIFIMQAYDIVGFESFVSHISSKPVLFEELGKATQIQSLSATKCDLGMGLYSDNSFFKNGNYYAIFHGYSFYNERPCSVIEYFCDESRLKVVDNSKGIGSTRDGNSYYSGYIYIDIDTGMIVAGTMLESVVAVQYKDEKTKVPVHIRRRIKMELLSNEGANSQ